MTKLCFGHKKLYHIVIYRHLTYKCDLGLGGYDLGVERDTSFNYGGHLCQAYHIVIYGQLTYKCDLEIGGRNLGVKRDK